MAGNIKGITIEFRGDTTKLDKALREVRNSAKDIDKELQQVNRALKFNPKNVQLLAQKQELLKQKVSQTETALKDLRNMQKQMDKDPSVDKNGEAYRTLQREIITTESKLKHFKGELAKVTAQTTKIYRLGDAFDAAGKKIESAGRKLSGLSRAAGAVTAAMGAVTYKAAAMADDINTLSKQTGISTHDLQMYAATADLVDVSVEAMAKSQTKLKKSMLTASEGGSTLTYFEQLGVSVTDANGELRDSNDVFQDTIKALGAMENETERDAIAMAIFGKSANELNPLIEDGGETYAKVAKMMQEYGLEPVSQEELDKANEFKDQIDTIKLVFMQAVQIIGTKIAGYLLPLMEKVTGAAAKVAEAIAGLSGGKLAKFTGLTAGLTALSPALIVAGKVVQLFGKHLKKVAEIVGKVSTKFPKAGKALRLFANPITLVVAALAGLGLAVGKSGKSADELVKIFDTMVKKAVAKVGELIPKIVEIIKSIGATIAKNAPVILQGLMTVLLAVLKAIPTYAPKLLQAAVNLFQMLVNAIPVVLPKLLSAITNLIGQVLKQLPTFAAALLRAAVSLFMAIVRAIPQVVSSLKAALPKIGSVMISYFKSLLQSIKNIFANIGTWLGNKFASAWSAIKSKFSGWSSFWGGLWNSIKNKFASIGTSIASAISGAVRSGINGVISRIESIINRAIGIINGAINLINKIPGVSVGKVSTVSFPRLAKGGVLNGAQTVVAGEAGPEAIIPLDRLFAQMDKMAETIKGEGGGDNIVINVYGAQGQSVRSLAEEVYKVIVQAEKRRAQAWA